MLLKQEVLESGDESPEKDYFRFVAEEGKAPDFLEQEISGFLDVKLKTRKTTFRRIYSLTSIAASLLIFFTVFYKIRETKIQKQEDNFFLMEQALFQVSETLKTNPQEDMVVLWVDKNVEIIIN